MGLYHPTAKGIVDGRIKGLQSALHVTMHIVTNGIKKIEIPKPYKEPGIEYYIGFGSGYEQGQKMRLFLENDTSSKMSLNEKIACFTFLLKKQEICHHNLSQLFLDNSKHWADFNIPLTNKNHIINLLHEDKIQRAIDTLLLFFKNNYQLKSLMNFYPISQKLKQIRLEARINKTKNIKENMEILKIDIINWIDS